MQITQDYLKSIFNYDPEEGQLTRIKTGVVVGSSVYFKTNKKRYIQIGLNNANYLAHRLIWLYLYGYWPDQVDHINGDGTDNRICNLRNVDGQENTKNKRKYQNNSSGVAGVHRWRETQWRAQITINKIKTHLGLYDDFFNAVCARKSAELKAQFHVNHGVERSL